MFELIPLLQAPVRLWLCLLPEETEGREIPFDPFRLAEPICGDLETWYGSVFRGVSLDRLPTVLRLGIDKEPTTAGIFADHFEKAWEYGGFPKLILMLDVERTSQSFREVPADTPEEELAELRARYRTMLTSEDGSHHWFSQFAEHEQCVGTAYEIAYGRYVPGDPLEALRAAIIFARPQDSPAVNAAPQ